MVGMVVVPMETRLAMVLAGGCDAVSVTALCAELEISRQTYYRLRRRYLAEGPAGLTPRSRRPHCCPGMVDPALELEIIRLRTDEGWPDPPRGAASIADELRRSGVACPAVSTIHRVLVRNGLVVAQPQKRPRASYTRFTYPDPNGCWQIDATRWELAEGSPHGVEAWVMDVLDDHSRVVVAAHACPGPTTTAAQAAVHAGGQRWGLPARILSDNGPCFGGVGRTGDFVDGLAALGIAAIHARPFHPQTCGKIERFHQTLKRWLRTQPRAASLVELQAQLDWFVQFYNHRRPHRALLADPSVLVLDEATSSLDVPTERLVQSALETVLSERTAVIIAHRLSTVLIADRVLVLSDGRIVQDGPPQALLAETGEFAALHAAWRASLA